MIPNSYPDANTGDRLMSKYIAAYVATAIAFLGGDMLWLGLVARNFYRDRLGTLLAPHPIIPAAISFYALFVAGIVIFAVAPGLRDNSWKSALVFGALFGFFAYATYDLTNLATLRGWPIVLTPVDLAWGTALTAVAALAGYAAATYVATVTV
jgi:uncharacterized membrane protein